MKRLGLALILLSILGPAAAQDLFVPDPPPGDSSNRIANTRWVLQNAGGGGGTVTSVFGRIGAVVATSGDYNSNLITNSSGVSGLSVSDALNTLSSSISGFVPTSRTISAGTGLTGGGDLSANRTLTLGSISAGTVLGNTTGGSTTPSGVTPSAVIDLIGSTRGSVLYRGASGWSALTPGTSGYVLTSNGTGADPTYQAAGGSGTVTSVASGTGLTGGPITTTGTLSLASVSNNTILSNISGGSAAPSANGLSSILDTISSTQGSILYRNSTAWVALSPGTSGQVLTTQGAGVNPAWVAAPNGNVPTGGSTGQVLAKASGTDYDTTWQTVAGTGTVVGPVSSTDNAIVRFDGTAGTAIQNSSITIDDSNNLANATSLGLIDTDASNNLLLAAGSNLSANRTLTLTTGDANRTLTFTGDATISGTNTGDQTITLTGDVTGSGTGSFAATIASNSVTSAKLADTSLKALTSLVPAADRVPYYDSSSTAALATFTSTGRNIVGGANAAAVRSTLGLGGAATLNVGTTAGTVAAGDDSRITGAIQASGGTMTGAFTEAVSALSNTATPALDASLGNIFTLTATTNPTIGIPSNPTSGQKITIRFTASGADRTMSLNTGTGGFKFGTDITALTATTSGTTDYVGAIYNSTSNKWDVVAYAKGY